MEAHLECWDDITCRDPRTAQSWLFSSLSSMTVLLSSYVLLAKVIGPKIMEKRKPVNVEKIMIVYNIVQTIANGWLAYKIATRVMTHKEYSFFCARTKIQAEDKEFESESFTYLRMYVLLKWVDLIDTVFMVFKKNFHQITFLHCYHHAMMVVAVTCSYIFFSSTHTAILGMSNSAVHSLMYFYYLCSAINPEVKKSVGLKKSITITQMASHFLVALHSSITLLNPYCGLSKIVTISMIILPITIFSLFAQFYYRAYIAPRPKSNEKKS